jgi:hypothetical protein
LHPQGSPTAGLTEATHDKLGEAGSGSEGLAATLEDEMAEGEAVEGEGVVDEAPIELER